MMNYHVDNRGNMSTYACLRFLPFNSVLIPCVYNSHHPMIEELCFIQMVILAAQQAPSLGPGHDN